MTLSSMPPRTASGTRTFCGFEKAKNGDIYVTEIASGTALLTKRTSAGVWSTTPLPTSVCHAVSIDDDSQTHTVVVSRRSGTRLYKYNTSLVSQGYVDIADPNSNVLDIDARGGTILAGGVSYSSSASVLWMVNLSDGVEQDRFILPYLGNPWRVQIDVSSQPRAVYTAISESEWEAQPTVAAVDLLAE